MTAVKRISVVVFGILFLCLAGAAAAEAQPDGDHQLEGSWFATITATDPAGLEPFKGLLTFTRDGNVIETRRLYVPASPFGPLIETPGHGAWVRLGARQFKATFMFLIQSFPDGVHIGNDNVEMVVEVSRDGNSLSGTFVSQVRDPAANAIVFFTATGTVSASRVRAD